jgi:UDP-N-acetylmuramate dehydrogenase
MLQIIENEPLKKHSSYKVGGHAKYFAEPKTNEDLIEILKWADKNYLNYFIFGRGSNVLFSDKGFIGIAISLKSLNNHIHHKDNIVFAGAGVILDNLIEYSINNYLQGLENISGIPGCIGGNIYMNAGAFGTEMKDVVHSVNILDKNLKIISMNNSEIGFKYRGTKNLNNKIILSADFKLNLTKDKNFMLNLRKDILEKRKLKQPLEYPSCGSVFKRPDNSYAGLLIEKCGLKGMQIGGAKVSKKHANFILNLGNATAQDIYDLILKVKEKVFKETGVLLEEEVKLIGF